MGREDPLTLCVYVLSSYLQLLRVSPAYMQADRRPSCAAVYSFAPGVGALGS